MPVPLLEMEGISKTFGSVRANDHVNLTLYPGDILGLLGENGAGKTTLMNVLFGVYTPDTGVIRINGKQVRIRNSADALRHGVGMVHQHFHLVPCHTVLENLMVGQKGRGGKLDRKTVLEAMHHVKDHFGLFVEPETLVSDLTIGEQQRLEIIKALIRGAKVLILDEPTSTLTPQETEGLFEALRAMSSEGMGVIFISHKLQEVQTITNRVVIMRRGKVTATLDQIENVSRHRLAELMCGYEIVPPVKEAVRPGEVLLAFKEVSTTGAARSRLKGVSFQLRAGEILGVAGVSGNGQRELAEIISGMLTPAAGSVEIRGKAMARLSPRYVQTLGVGRIPEDRMEIGLITTLPLKDNMILPRVHEPRFSRRGVLKLREIDTFAREQIRIFDIRTPSPDIRTGALSGGNLQKALLARELAWDPLVLLADQPTRGLDVAAAQFVHEKFLELRRNGRGVLLISEDLEELFTLSDRIAVMYEGRINGIVPIAEATVQKIGLLMAGMKEEVAA